MTVISYPADISPTPVLAYGTLKLSEDYTGNCLAVTNNLSQTHLIGFSDSGTIDADLIDSLIGVDGLDTLGVTTWYDQISGKDVQQVYDNAPHVNNITVAGYKALVFAGGTQSGEIHSLSSSSIASLEIGNRWTVMAVVQPSVSNHINQAGAPAFSSGTVVNLVNFGPVEDEGNTTGGSPIITSLVDTSTLGSGFLVAGFKDAASPEYSTSFPTKISSVDSGTQITVNQNLFKNETDTSFKFCLHVARVAVDGSEASGVRIDDFDDVGYTSTNTYVPTHPFILTAVSGATNCYVAINEQTKAVATPSTVAVDANAIYVGTLAGTFTDAQSQAYDGALIALLVWDRELTLAEQAVVRAGLYNRININPDIDRLSTPLVVVMGDSIAAGYTTLGSQGWAQRVQKHFGNDIRFCNLADAGSTAAPIAVDASAQSYMTGTFPLRAERVLYQAKGPCVFIVAGGGNDFTAALSAATVYASIVELVNLALSANSNTKVYVSTVKERDVAYNSDILSLNTLIRDNAGDTNYTVVDVAAIPEMQVGYPTRTDYFAVGDVTHPNELGHQLEADVWVPILTEYFESV